MLPTIGNAWKSLNRTAAFTILTSVVLRLFHSSTDGHLHSDHRQTGRQLNFLLGSAVLHSQQVLLSRFDARRRVSCSTHSGLRQRSAAVRSAGTCNFVVSFDLHHGSFLDPGRCAAPSCKRCQSRAVSVHRVFELLHRYLGSSSGSFLCVVPDPLEISSEGHERVVRGHNGLHSNASVARGATLSTTVRR